MPITGLNAPLLCLPTSTPFPSFWSTCHAYLLLVYVVGSLHEDYQRRHLLHVEAVALAVYRQILHGLRPPRKLKTLTWDIVVAHRSK